MNGTIETSQSPGLKRLSLEEYVLRQAKCDEAVYPTIGETTGGAPVIVDTDSGRVWAIELRELK